MKIGTKSNLFIGVISVGILVASILLSTSVGQCILPIVFVALFCCFTVQIIQVDNCNVTVKWLVNPLRKKVTISISAIDKVVINYISNKGRWIRFEMKDGTQQRIQTFFFPTELRKLQHYFEDQQIVVDCITYW